ncbi:hypothetical protein WR25_21183 [Diploscapter pachys]|uniref:Glycosyltransferase 2-like domain-containing protein n=1 Tax=Diploscapter pachys TaxID=2018661 RepID=A0A2A2LDB4_9BILA|nr:hypothetical protein WR25_21183 [Diploscapter pachys]
MNTVQVSVVIPVKDGEAFLPSTLSSLLTQSTSAAFEICIYDDGSSDRTPEIVDQFRGRFQAAKIPLKYERGEQSGGVGFAKNRACLLAEGEFLCFNDADDISHEFRIERQYEIARKIAEDRKMVFVGCNVVRDPPDSTERYVRWANQLTDEDLTIDIYSSHGPTLLAPTWFISRSLFLALNGFNEDHKTGFPEDLDFFYRALDRENVVFRKGKLFCDFQSPEVLVTYRYHPGCASFGVDDDTIFRMRLNRLQSEVLSGWEKFSVWGAGRQGKRFFK